MFTAELGFSTTKCTFTHPVTVPELLQMMLAAGRCPRLRPKWLNLSDVFAGVTSHYTHHLIDPIRTESEAVGI